MKASVRLLSWSLLAAAIATGAFGATNQDLTTGSKPADRAAQESHLMLAGANGHDTVGGLMPLPLWPSGTVYAQEAVPARPGNASRDRAAAPCTIAANPSGMNVSQTARPQSGSAMDILARIERLPHECRRRYRCEPEDTCADEEACKCEAPGRGRTR
jgi:hypothetical protein